MRVEWEICEECEGIGYIDCSCDLYDHTCPECDGKGTVFFLGEEEICPMCNGEGEILCERCEGTGEIECECCGGDGYVEIWYSNGYKKVLA